MKKKHSGRISPPEQAALSFLLQDFNQCFEQMRYYDGQMISIFRFIFVAYTFLTGVVTSLYQYYGNHHLQLQMPAVITLSVALALGVFSFAIIIRNRIYFVRVARYINEQRAMFLAWKPMGFENQARMYIRPEQPLYFNGWSSQSWLLYIMAFLNAMVLLAIGFFTCGFSWGVYLLAALIFTLQLLAAVWTLKAYE
ncbi:hypothetical protein JW933_02500 [candidate division FCPU426 bacterium]|nr:hypothetical protein [candidate division FCPU426 bacterium]